MNERCSFEVEVAAEDIFAFSQLSGDHNPLHTDGEYARTTEYGRPIAHGAFLVGLVSRVLGMHIPGEAGLILAMKARFAKPLFYPARVQVTGELRHFDRERNIGSVRVRIVDLARLWCVLESEVSFGLRTVGDAVANVAAGCVTEPHRDAEVGAAGVLRRVAGRGDWPRLLVTGGTGGIGSRLLPDLVTHYDVSCLTRKPPPETRDLRIAFEQVDVEDEDGLECYLERNEPSAFYGVLHLSVPPVSRKFVSDDVPGVRRHLRHSVEVPVLLAKWARQPGSNVKRIVLLGSTAGSNNPRPNLGAYSLGKAAMEHVSRLLTADLSAQGATVNIVLPTALPVGLHEGMPELTRQGLIGKMPTGRLVEPRDIANVVLFLLSDAAAQINGATIAVDGGLVE